MARPTIQPTDEQRRLAKSLAAFGIPQEKIAQRLGIRSLKTLRKYYRDDLDAGALEANFAVIKTMYSMATSGRHPVASMYWLDNRAGWNPRFAYQQPTGAPPPFIVAREDGEKKP
jgi:hypothetical protein